jgi:uncharacterized protein (TIGR03083 family)
MTPLQPVDVAPLFEPLRAELLTLLRELAPDAWNRPTVASRWRVRDVVAHLVDGDLRVLSFLRDGHAEPPEEPIGGYDDLVGFLNRLNADWVRAAGRLSPRVMIELLEWAGPRVAAVYAALPPDEPAAFPVAWAGEETSVNWMHVGREYTERWHHQMQVRDAVGAPGLFERRWLAPLLDLSVRALPHAYRAVEASEGATVTVEVTGEGGGEWTLRREGDWGIYAGSPALPSTTRVRLDPDTAWKTLYHALTPEAARERAEVEGDEELAAPLFRARSVMV